MQERFDQAMRQHGDLIEHELLDSEFSWSRLLNCLELMFRAGYNRALADVAGMSHRAGSSLASLQRTTADRKPTTGALRDDGLSLALSAPIPDPASSKFACSGSTP
ncbi:MAG: hypothetical protein KGL39_11995 [Patescibacteria group bacterium]|nr:hypothetical protein [Patescibacteria group bacterium]